MTPICWRIFITLGILLAFVPEPAPAQASGKPIGVKTASLTGVVADADSAMPIKGATVKLLGGARGNASVTDEDGRYTLANVSPGEAFVEISAPGYATLSPFTGPADARIRIPSDGSEATFNFRLAREASIAGTVFDAESRKPVSNVTVQALRVEFHAGERRLVIHPESATTDHNGQFAIGQLQEDAYYLEITPPQRETIRSVPLNAPYQEVAQVEYVRTYYPGVQELAGATPIFVSARQEHRGFDIYLRKEPVFLVRGTFAGIPDSATSVTMIMQDAWPGGYKVRVRGKIEANEQFEISNLAAGTYRVTAWTAGVATGDRRVFDDTLTLTRRDLTDVSLPMNAGTNVNGQIDVAQDKQAVTPVVAGMKVWLRPIGRLPFPDETAVPISIGRPFVIPNVPQGRYWLELIGLTRGLHVKEIFFGGRKADYSLIDLSGGQLDNSLKIELSATGAVIHGRVTDGDRVVPSAGVALLRAPLPDKFGPGTLRITTCDAEGRFAFTDIPEGQYKLLAVRGNSGILQRRDFLEQHVSTADLITVKPKAVLESTLTPIR
ncbi:MAG: carboxypeptidase regulatory-like domain-containing protein [Bryobacteraceae bacterium]|nr:carboxypeptidase regulatory-like domain-containing protein [Bryobacteraceae bacterium]